MEVGESGDGHVKKNGLVWAGVQQQQREVSKGVEEKMFFFCFAFLFFFCFF